LRRTIEQIENATPCNKAVKMKNEEKPGENNVFFKRAREVIEDVVETTIDVAEIAMITTAEKASSAVELTQQTVSDATVAVGNIANGVSECVSDATTKVANGTIESVQTAAEIAAEAASDATSAVVDAACDAIGNAADLL